MLDYRTWPGRWPHTLAWPEPNEVGPEQRIIVAVDLTDVEQIRRLRLALDGKVGGFKLGPVALHAVKERQLYTTSGCSFDSQGVFLDLKLHDIPNTVQGAMETIAGWRHAFVSVHAAAGPDALTRAVRLCQPEGTVVLAITVLSSQTGAELAALNGLTGDQVQALFGTMEAYRREVTLMRARMAHQAGCGIVCSGETEIELVREACPEALIVAPGIRFTDGAAGDQKAICTPYEAIDAGADLIVMGREITGAADPVAAAERAAEEIGRALAERGQDAWTSR